MGNCCDGLIVFESRAPPIQKYKAGDSNRQVVSAIAPLDTSEISGVPADVSRFKLDRLPNFGLNLISKSRNMGLASISLAVKMRVPGPSPSRIGSGRGPVSGARGRAEHPKSINEPMIVIAPRLISCITFKQLKFAAVPRLIRTRRPWHQRQQLESLHSAYRPRSTPQ